MPTAKFKPLPTDFSFSHLFLPNLHYPYYEQASDYPFKHDSHKFQLVNAWWLAEASFLVYVTKKGFVRNSLKKAGFSHVEFFNSPGKSPHDTQCFVAHHEHFIVVAFRGTEPGSPKDLVTDLRFDLVESGQGGKVHRGFREGLDDIWEPLSMYLQTIRQSDQTVWMTGHSLGGALATLAADRFGNVRGLYTYGCPRVGDREFGKDFDIATYRFINNNDIIPHIPLAGLYEHIGALKYIDREGHIHDNPALARRLTDSFLGNFSYLFNSLGHWRWGFPPNIPFDSLVDHAPIHYAIHVWNNYVKDL